MTPSTTPSVSSSGSPSGSPGSGGGRLLMWGMTGYQWTVVLAAWLGWGFDVFDGLLFNYVAPNCVPALLGLAHGSAEARRATLFWSGALTSILLIGWGIGGIVFGTIADRLGRTRTLLLTMLMYALGTAACAAAPNLWVLILFRFVASLGIGGEWAAGAAMVAEVVPERRRVEAGALLYTSAPMGLFLATFVNFQIAGVWLGDSPQTSWRYVFLAGLIPAAVAFILRLFIREPERWQQAAGKQAAPRIRELFTPENRALTLSGLAMALVALLTWWTCNAFLPTVATGLARVTAKAQALDTSATLALVEHFKKRGTNFFNLGGLIGTLLTVPAAKIFGRRFMFALYFGLSAVAVYITFGLDLTPETRIVMFFADGLTVFGVFGAFTYYLPELFPTRLRGTGAGFCYNTGRFITAAGPFFVGFVSAHGKDALTSALQVLTFVAVIPLAGAVLARFIVETKHRALLE